MINNESCFEYLHVIEMKKVLYIPEKKEEEVNKFFYILHLRGGSRKREDLRNKRMSTQCFKIILSTWSRISILSCFSI